MFSAFRLLDQILRGDATRLDQLQKGKVEIPRSPLLFATLVLGITYGVCLGAYAPIRGGDWLQPVASGIKIPLLFGLTLLVTLPSLYVFSAIVGSRLSFDSVVRLLLAMIGVSLAVCASLGPIVIFFAISTDSYPFMLLLAVIASALGGFLGLAFLLRTLHRLIVVQEASDLEARFGPQPSGEPTADAPGENGEDSTTPPAPSPPRLPSALERMGAQTDERARAVFRVWVVVFSLVGAQMSWVLRPFVGSPDLPFQMFRPRESNFFEAFWRTLVQLFGG